MVLRDISIGDLVELEEKAQFPIENFMNKPMIVQKTFEDEFGLIGSIVVNRTVELVAIFNDKRSKRDLYNAMKAMPDFLYKTLAPLGYKDIHAFVKDPKFAEIMIKHFDFSPCKGQAIVRLY